MYLLCVRDFCASKNVPKVVCVCTLFFVCFAFQFIVNSTFIISGSEEPKPFFHLKKKNQNDLFSRMSYRKPSSTYNKQMNYTIR